jgi:hypothetical protein
MFKSYEEPPKPAYDWTDMLVERGIPLLGTAGGAIAGGLIAGPPGVAAGASLGAGLGNMVSGAISEKPTAEAKMARGLAGAQQGYKDWRELPPEKKLDTDEKGKIPGLPTGDSLVKIPTIPQMSVSKPEDEDPAQQGYDSPRARMFAKGTLFGS